MTDDIITPAPTLEEAVLAKLERFVRANHYARIAPWDKPTKYQSSAIQELFGALLPAGRFDVIETVLYPLFGPGKTEALENRLMTLLGAEVVDNSPDYPTVQRKAT